MNLESVVIQAYNDELVKIASEGNNTKRNVILGLGGTGAAAGTVALDLDMRRVGRNRVKYHQGEKLLANVGKVVSGTGTAAAGYATAGSVDKALAGTKQMFTFSKNLAAAKPNPGTGANLGRENVKRYTNGLKAQSHGAINLVGRYIKAGKGVSATSALAKTTKGLHDLSKYHGREIAKAKRVAKYGLAGSTYNILLDKGVINAAKKLKR